MEFEEFLSKPIETIGFSEEFNEKARKMHLKTLREIIEITADQPMRLFNRKGFSYHWLEELISFFVKHNQITLLQSIPGKVSSNF